VCGVPHRLYFRSQRVQRVLGLRQRPVRCERDERGESYFCNFGRVPADSGVWQCLACPAGSWSENRIGSADDCTSCGVGKYSAGTGQAREGVCTACLAGTYSAKARGVQVFWRFYSKIGENGYFSTKSGILSRMARA
jgi:hypothetical protein